MNAIEVENLTKIYRLYKSPRDRLREFFSPTRRKYYHEFPALKDVTFKVEKGQTVGVIGPNGSGKSTLLKIISGIVQPTNGNVKVNGRISSLLELGAGFHPEFTGRENVYMNGALMGLNREEMDRRFRDIEEFAEIGEFIGQPVKSYSSGMFVRLAFATAVKIDPEILVVDEALGVGDMYFTAKCMIHMKKMIDKGVTMLFVSHDMGAVKSLCQKCAFLEKGKIVDFGQTSQVVSEYLKKSYLQMNKDLKVEFSERERTFQNSEIDQANVQDKLLKSTHLKEILVSTSHETGFPKTANRFGDGGVRILDVKVLNSQHQPTKQLELRENFFIQVSIRFDKLFPTFAVGFSIKDLKGLNLVGTVTSSNDMKLPSVSPGDVYVFEIRSTNRLTQGVYTVSVGVELPVLYNQRHITLDSIENAVVFKSNFPSNPSDHIHVMVLVPTEIEYIKV